MDEPKPLKLVLAGTEIPMRPQTSKYGNTYYAVLDVDEDGNRYNSPYGVQITPLADELPKVATVDGHLIELSPPDDSGRRMAGETLLEIGDDVHTASVKVTRRKDDDWQLTAVAHKARKDEVSRSRSGALDPTEL